MHRGCGWLIGTCVIALSLSAGCAGFYKMSAAKDRAAVDLNCPKEKIVVQDVGGGAYRATGCGGVATYVCSAQVCAKESVEPTEEGAPPSQAVGEAPVSTAQGPDDAQADDEAVAAAKDALRTAIDQRREDILACVGGDRAAIIADAVPDGAVVLSLQGELAGSPQEECLRRAVSDLRIAPRETGFTLIHLVR